MPLKSKIIQLSFKRSQPAGLARPFLIKNRLLMDYLFQLLDTDNSVGQSTFNNNLKRTTMTQQSTLLIIRFATAICDCDLRESLRKCNKQTDLLSVKVKSSSQTKFHYIYISRNQCIHVSLKISKHRFQPH